MYKKHQFWNACSEEVRGQGVMPEYESLVSVCRESGIAYQEAYNIVYAELNQSFQTGQEVRICQTQK